MRALRTWLCAHVYLRAFEPHRVFLRCERCGLETPGWRDDYEDIQKPRVRIPTPPRPFKVVKSRRRSA
jgi:hypothetical protein